MASENNNNNVEWTKDKLKFVLHSGQEAFSLEAIAFVTKEIWTTSEINEKGASALTDGLFATPLPVLQQMIKDALGETKKEVTYKTSFESNNSVLKLALSVTFYVETKTFTLVMNKKEVNDVWRLEQIILDLRAELETTQKKLETCEKEQLAANKRMGDIEKMLTQPNKILFTAWRGDMITFSNTSHTPQNDTQKLSFMNSGTTSVIAWDGKTSGWIQFTFDNPIKCVASRFKAGCGTWDIEYSDNGTNWSKAATFVFLNANSLCTWDVGTHKYWRYNLVQNTGAPYYHGYEWYYLL